MTGRALLIELRRSAFTPVALALAAAQVALMLNDAANWRGVWPMASAQVSAQWWILAPVAAGLAAFLRLRRVRLPGASTGDPGGLLRNRSAAMLAAHAGLACLVVLVGCVFAVVVNVKAGAPTGFLWPSYVWVAVAFAVESVAVGHLLGSLGGPLWFAPVAAVMTTFLRASWGQSTGVGTPGAAFARVFLAGDPYVALEPAGVLIALFEAALVVLLALVAPRLLWSVQLRRAGRTLPLGAPAAARGLATGALLVVGAVVVTQGPPLTGFRPPPARALCTATATQVCVWPEDAVYLPALTAIAQRSQTVARQMNAMLPPQIGQVGLAADQLVNFDFLGGSTWSVTSTMADVIAGSLVAPVTCTPPPDRSEQTSAYFRSRSEVSALVELRISGEPRPAGLRDSSGVDWAEVTSVWRSPPQQQQAWLDTRLRATRTASEAMCR